MLYVIFVFMANLIIIVVNLLIDKSLYNLGILKIILASVISTVAVIIIDAVLAFIIRRLPEKWFDENKTFYSATKKLCIFYEKLGIKKWKDKIPELGGFTSFHKNKLLDPKNNEYIKRFILECNYGVVIHFSSVFLGFLVVFIYPLKYAFMFGIPVSLVNGILNLLPYFILRYNLYKLHVLYKFNSRNN